jgi:hypothetical protein
MKTLAYYTKPEVLRNIATLCLDECFPLNQEVRDVTPQGVLDECGGNDEEFRDEYGIVGMSAIDAVVHILTSNPSWGEFMSSVCDALPSWDAATRAVVEPALERALEYGATRGIDH